MPAVAQIVLDDQLMVHGFWPIDGYQLHYSPRNVIGRPLSDFGWVVEGLPKFIDALKCEIVSGASGTVRYTHRLSGHEIAHFEPLTLLGWSQLTLYSNGRKQYAHTFQKSLDIR